ncbi:MAG: aldo/keto reductase [Clostridia bacterium]|nr:aldo/keto reductase [Clostridia bacterium]
MKTVTLGRTGITSPKNAFGALPIQRVSEAQAAELLIHAYEEGITFFDTARMYTDSERKIGLALSQVREKITIATKSHAKDKEGLIRDLHTSLELLKTDYIDIYQLHNPSVMPRPDDGSGMYEVLLDAKRQGLIKHIGITNHRPDVAREAVLSGLYETLQFPFCYLATEGDIELVNLCREKNVGFIAMKGLSGGLITNARLAYAWMLAYDNVLPIWGVQKRSELDEFLALGKEEIQLDDDMLRLIDADRQELVGGFCRGCGYCMPCPVGIEINNSARMSQLIRRSPSEPYLTPEWQKKMLLIEDCIGCNSCASKCPYGLNTPELLRKNLEDYKNIISGKTSIK